MLFLPPCVEGRRRERLAVPFFHNFNRERSFKLQNSVEL
jgi:hypothetical protein